MKVTGEGRIKESITRKRQASSIASVGSTCGLNLKIPGESISPVEMDRENYVQRSYSRHINILTSCLLQETGSRWFQPRRD